MTEDELDERQLEVIQRVLAGEQRLLVLGGPGTGKTTVALFAARKFLESAPLSPQPRVLFLTFSRSAVSQILSRAVGVLGPFTERIEVLTFHGLAYRLLRAFGQYMGYGGAQLSIQSEARAKLLGTDTSQLTYNDLMPLTLRLLRENKPVLHLCQSRWSLVICDEAQDTNPDQFELMQALSAPQYLLLGDVNQLIYEFVPGVSPERFEEICAWASKKITLDLGSHRDPSGRIPLLAEGIRTRNFDSPVLREAVADGYLTVVQAGESSATPSVLLEQIEQTLRTGSRDVGVFAHSNASVAEIANFLDEQDIDHILVGIPEAHAEALSAMIRQCQYAVDQASSEELRLGLGIFLTCVVRTKDTPPLALALAGRDLLPEGIENSIRQLERGLRATNDQMMGNLVELVSESWIRIAISAGRRSWRRAVAHFGRLARSLQSEPATAASVERLAFDVDAAHREALIDLNYSERSRIKLMNLHQTKGREADAVIHIFQDSDYFGRESEPFEKLSRLMNVAFSRARKRVIVILPPNPHAVIQPLENLLSPDR